MIESIPTEGLSVTDDLMTTHVPDPDLFTYKKHSSYFGPTVNYIFGTIDLILALICLFPNTVIIIYYRKKLYKVVPFCFSLLAFGDFCSGSGALLHSLVFFLINNNGPEDLQYIIRIAFFATSLALKISVFVSLMISIIRTINIMNPFKQINIWHIAISFLSYTVIWLSLVGMETGLSLVFSPYDVPGNKYIDRVPSQLYTTGNTLEFLFHLKISFDKYRCIIEYIFAIIPCMLPAQIAFVCMILQFRRLRNRCAGREVTKDSVQEQRNLTITIFLLTMVFFVCNTAGVFIPTFTVCKSDYLHKPDVKQEYIVTYIIGIILPFVNSALNPIIMINRGKSMRLFVVRHYTIFKRKSRTARLSLNSLGRTTQVSFVVENVSVTKAKETDGSYVLVCGNQAMKVEQKL